jgi:DNA-binding transcriptional MerR regulator
MATTLTIGDLARQANVAATTLRYYEQIGLLRSPVRVGGKRRYDDSILARLEVIRLCKAAGFALDEIQMLFADDEPGRPATRALAETKLAQIDTRIAELLRAREIIEWGMRCTCPSIDDCTCGIHNAKPVSSRRTVSARAPLTRRRSPRGARW